MYVGVIVFDYQIGLCDIQKGWVTFIGIHSLGELVGGLHSQEVHSKEIGIG